MTKDSASHEVKYKIKKFNTDEAKRTGEPDEVSEFEENIFLEEGIGAIWDSVTGLAAVTSFDNTNAAIGVGDGTTAEDATHTGLQGANTAYSGMDTGYPTRSGTTVTFYSTFGDTEANFAWEEFTVANAADGTGTNINRKVSSQGTKSNGTTWEIEVQLTIA